MSHKNQKPPICIGGSEKPRVMNAPPLHERTFSRTLPHKRGWCRAVIGMGFAHHYLYLIFTVTSFLKFVNTQKWWLVFGVPTMRRSNAHYSRPIQRPNDLCVMLLCCAPLPQQSYRSPLTVTAKQQRISQGGAFDDLTRSFVVSGKLRSDTEVCTAINQ